MRKRDVRMGIVLVGLVGCLALGCGGGDGDGHTAAPPVEDSARVLPIPGGGSGELPPGHPATDSGAAANLVAWTLPGGWIEGTPSSRMRYAQYTIPGKQGDGECVVYYFGPGQGGDPMSNAQRWAGQFQQPDGRSSLDLMAVNELDGAKLPTTIVEVTGTYDGGMTMTDAPSEPQPGSMLLGAILQGPDAPWFFKFTGPEGTVRAQRDAFVEMLLSARAPG